MSHTDLGNVREVRDDGDGLYVSFFEDNNCFLVTDPSLEAVLHAAQRAGLVVAYTTDADRRKLIAAHATDMRRSPDWMWMGTGS